MKAPENTTLDLKLPLTPSPAPLLSIKALRRRDFAIAWILGHSTAQHTYETKHSPFKRRLLPNPKQDFHRRYRGIVGILGYLVTMTRPDLAWSYSELSKYVQFPGIAHIEAAEHVL